MNAHEIKHIREQLREHLDANPQFSITGVARAIAKSGATLSLFLADKYTGDNAKVATEVASYLAREKEKAAQPQLNFPFVMTRNARRIFEVAQICHLQGEIGVVYGEAGVGKTEAVREYARQNKSVILIEVDPSFSAAAMVKSIHRSLGEDGKGGIFELFETVVRQLSATGRMVIVDQAELLPHRALELLRAINDKAGVGVLMLGMPVLRANIVGRQGEFAQLYSRVGLAIRLAAWDKDDVKSVVEQAIPSSNTIHAEFFKHSQNGRKLNKLIKRTIMVARNNNVGITPDTVNTAAKFLMF